MSTGPRTQAKIGLVERVLCQAKAVAATMINSMTLAMGVHSRESIQGNPSKEITLEIWAASKREPDFVMHL